MGVFFFLVHWGAQSLHKGPVCVGCFPQKYLADIFELMHEWYFARCGERPAFFKRPAPKLFTFFLSRTRVHPPVPARYMRVYVRAHGL